MGSGRDVTVVSPLPDYLRLHEFLRCGRMLSVSTGHFYQSQLTVESHLILIKLHRRQKNELLKGPQYCLILR